MDLVVHHGLSYTTRGTVPVSLVARSLLANERLIHEALSVLTACIPGIGISSVQVSVGQVTNASPLKNLLIAALVIQWQDDLVKEVPDIIKSITGHDVPDNMDTLVTLLVCALAIYLVSAAVERMTPGKSLKALKRELEEQKAIAARLLGVDADTIQKAIELRITENKRKSLWATARDFFAPAQLERSTEIVMQDGNKISNDAIAEVPRRDEIVLFPDPRTYEVFAVAIEVHRSDRDQNEHGWRAVIPEVSDRKVRLVLAENIVPAELYGAETIIGDVAVVEDTNADGVTEPSAYHLTRLLRS